MCIAIIGTGYAGLVPVACLADFGHMVTLAGEGPSEIERRETEKIPVFVPCLEEYFSGDVLECRRFFDRDVAEAIKISDAVFSTVAMPTRRRPG